VNPPPKPNIPAFSLRADLPSLCLLMARVVGLFAALNLKLLFGHLLAGATFFLFPIPP
jgi:hypothetical protein